MHRNLTSFSSFFPLRQHTVGTQSLLLVITELGGIFVLTVDVRILCSLDCLALCLLQAETRDS